MVFSGEIWRVVVLLKSTNQKNNLASILKQQLNICTKHISPQFAFVRYTPLTDGALFSLIIAGDDTDFSTGKIAIGWQGDNQGQSS